MTEEKKLPDPTSGPAMPKWQCHKVVSADKVKEIYVQSKVTKDETGVRIVLECGRVVAPTHDLFRRMAASSHKLKVGDYYVEYADGYASYSPASAFEEGYTRQ